MYVLPFQLFSFATLQNNNLKHLAQEGTTAMHTPWGCHPTPPDSQLSCLRAFSLFRREWGGGWQPCTAGSISGLTLDANANIGLGMEQTL